MKDEYIILKTSEFTLLTDIMERFEVLFYIEASSKTQIQKSPLIRLVVYIQVLLLSSMHKTCAIYIDRDEII